MLRDGYELKVMVRLPREQRLSVQDINDFILRGSDGVEIPLSRAADFAEGNAYSTITREDGQRTLTVTGSFDKASANTRRIRSALEQEVLPELKARYPGPRLELRRWPPRSQPGDQRDPVRSDLGCPGDLCADRGTVSQLRAGGHHHADHPLLGRRGDRRARPAGVRSQFGQHLRHDRPGRPGGERRTGADPALQPAAAPAIGQPR